MSTDRQLLQQWRDGDKAAGERLFDRYYPLLMRFFANKIGDDPMDLIQETFLGCVSGQARLRDEQGFRSYLFGIAYNQLRSYYQRRRVQGERFEPATHTAADLSPGPGTMVARGAQQRLILDALRRIPVRFQVVLELFYWEELTSAEIAEALELPHGTVRTRLRRARVLLLQALGEAQAAPEVIASTRDQLDAWVAKIRASLER